MKYQETKPLKLGPKIRSKYPHDDVMTHKLKTVKRANWFCHLNGNLQEPVFVDPLTGDCLLLDRAYAVIKERGNE